MFQIVMPPRRVGRGHLPRRYVDKGFRQEGADTSRIREFLGMNPPNFMGSSTTEDPENFIEELRKIFDVMHVVDTEQVKLAAYQLKYVTKTWFDQWKGGRVENAPLAS
ncbi:hypothetical protein MTR67_027756 [Solanum verrucosum]|uniref:Gag-pol polyprotein n=1 Tax=Solanum verrucosum TaxID=315347 RepID=A0AAF0TVQ0_SOLVR|nr:hypothetical protein MTR67_027756 [Solanum verrucosum]